METVSPNAPITSDNIHLSQPTQGRLAGSSEANRKFSAVQDCTDPKVLEFIAAATASNTRRAYPTDLAHFLACGGTVPATSEAVAAYIAAHAKTLSAATLARRIVAIRRTHALAGFHDPTKAELIRLTLRGIRRLHGRPRAKGMLVSEHSFRERQRPEYVMAHSLAHALMIEVAIDCGYPASALKERLYAFPPAPGQPLQCGILIYTATAGNQGRLGGLVEVTRRFVRILKSALERQRLCSGDPVCADHDPATADEDRTLHGAACRGCLLVAETSCEARNLFLDRALI
jgi:Domain of unknown function (DUF1998)